MICSQLLHNLFTTYSWLFWTCSQPFKIYSILVHDIFRICSFEHFFLMTCSLSVLDLFWTCSWLVRNFFTIFLIFVHNLFMPSSGLVHSCFTIYSQLFSDCFVLVHSIFPILVHDPFTTCSFEHYFFITCSLFIHDFFTICNIFQCLFTIYSCLVHRFFKVYAQFIHDCSGLFHDLPSIFSQFFPIFVHILFIWGLPLFDLFTIY